MVRREPIVSGHHRLCGHLTSLFQCRVRFRVIFRVGFRVSSRVRLRVVLLALHYFLPHFFRSID